MNRIMFIAHRGYSSIAPENTIPAFAEAASAGFGGIECDVWETAGKGLMIMHDENLSRMCGVNQSITALTPGELEKIPVIKGKGISLYGGNLKIPSLKEYLTLFRGNQVSPVIELKSKNPANEKNAMSKDSLLRILELLEAEQVGDRTMILSFNMATLLRILDVKRRKYPAMGLIVMYLTSRKKEVTAEKMKAYREQGIDGIGMKVTVASPGAILGAQMYGLRTGIWVVDNKALAKKLVRANHVDCITSNKKIFPLE